MPACLLASPCPLAVLLLSAVLQEVRSADTVGPVLIHVITEKGRGYLPAETAQVSSESQGLCSREGQGQGAEPASQRCSKQRATCTGAQAGLCWQL